MIADQAHVVDARRFVGKLLSQWGLERVADTAVLLTSEVVSNAVIHAGPHLMGAGLAVLVRSNSGMVRVEVSDGSTVIPVFVDAPPEALSGRGLLLLDALATSWGSTPNRVGKSVWFEIEADE